MNLKQLGLMAVASAALALAGCGSNSNSSSGVATGSQTVSGTAAAPGGAVAIFIPRTMIDVAMDFVITPALAEITGLKPIKGATVELIRVNNDGEQIGDVLAATVTSITGDYTLTLPVGVDLSGDLILRISGRGGAEMRAQVVEKSVDITPVSEFVLQKFIDSGTDLDNLVVTDVVQLRGQVEAFDLAATGDLSDMLAALEAEAGEFVDNSVDAITAEPGNAASLVGDYRSIALDLGLHDGDGSGFGTFAVDMWQSDFRFAEAPNGDLKITWLREEGANVMISGEEMNADFHGETYTEEDTEIFFGTFAAGANGIATLFGDFEENIDPYVDGDPQSDCCGWRWLPGIYRLQKVQDRGLLFLISENAAVRYGLVDTDDDNEVDAVNPNDRKGDEVTRALELFAREPAGMTNADLTGDFGRVWFGVSLYSIGPSITLSSESNIITFGGDGTFADAGVAVSRDLWRTGYQTDTAPSSTGTVTVTSDGDITHIDAAPVDGFINDAFDFIAFSDAEAVDDGQTSKTLMVKLGAGVPAVTGNTYRLMLMDVVLSGNSIEIISSRFSSQVTMASESTGSLALKTSELHKDDIGAEIVVTNGDTETLGISAVIGAKGATTITVDDSEGIETLEGFFNADATLGVFRTHYTPDAGDPDSMGIAVLVKTN